MTRRYRKQRAQSYRDPHFWITVEVQMHCALGDHQCERGTRMRGRRGDHARRFSCAACLKRHYDVDEPKRPWTFTSDDGVDARAKRAGDE